MNNCATNYYASLAMAIADINGDTSANALVDSSSAKVKVVTDCTGGITVSLLANDDYDSIITVEKDMVLELGDKVLSFTGEGSLDLVAGTDVTINGGTLQREIAEVIVDDGNEEKDESNYLVQTAGKLKINDGSYQISGYRNSGFVAIKATDTCALLEVSDANVSATNGENESGTGVKAIQSQAAVTVISNTSVTADSANVTQGVFGLGTITIGNSNISVHSRNDSARAVYNLGGDLRIYCTTMNTQSDTLSAQTVYMTDGTAMLKNCIVNASTTAGYTQAINLVGGTATVEDSSIHAITYAAENTGATGIETHSGTTIHVRNTTILADSRGDEAVAWLSAVAFSNNGTAYLEDVTLNGVHSGLSNRGKLYVNGGTYTGFCHGGFYFAHGADGEAFVNDAVIRGGHYEGIFDFSNRGRDKFGALYIGGGTGEDNNNVTAYLDGCTFDASDCHRAIIIRGSMGEQNNTINISNSYVEDGFLNDGAIRIDNETLKLNIGVGTNITDESLKNAFIVPDGSPHLPQYEVNYLEVGCAEYTGQLYRRQPGDYTCNGKDLAAVTDWVSPVEKQLIITEEMDSITQNFTRPDNGKVEIFLYVPPVSDAVTSKATFKIGGMTLFEGFLMSDSSNCGTAFVEYHVRKDAPVNPVHYFTHCAGLADLHASSIVPKDMADSVTVIAPAGTAFPKGTRLYVSVKEI